MISTDAFLIRWNSKVNFIWETFGFWNNFSKMTFLFIILFMFDGLLSMIKLAGYPITGFFDRRTDQFQVFSRFLAMAEVEFWFIYVWDKHGRWIQLKVSVTDHKCDIGIWSIFDSVFPYLPIFLKVLRYWVTPQCSPPFS